MKVIRVPAHADARAPVLVVMLPAAYSEPQDFVQAGFAAAAHSKVGGVDLVFAGLELAHVTDRSELERLETELLAPARAAGTRLWLGGISLGAYFALSAAERCAGALDGLCLLAPYLGSHLVTREIERAGGPARWAEAAGTAGDEERRIWRFIAALADAPLEVHLGLGREDRFADRHRLLARALDPLCVDSVPGGHDWPTWRLLWERFLDRRLAGGAPLAARPG